MSVSSNYKGIFPYRWCIVAECESSSVKTPDKLWIEAPTDVDARAIWLNLAFRDHKKLPISRSQMYFCEDHFDLENDMENYQQYKTQGSVKKVRMKPTCIPTRFDCQSYENRITTTERQPPLLAYSSTTEPAPSVTQTQMPILLTLLTENFGRTCLPQDVTDTALLVTLFCVCCLAKDVPFVRLLTCCHAEFLHSIVMPKIKPKHQVICYQCHNMLKKIKQFKLQVEESFKLLSDSSENIPKNSNQKFNYERQDYSMQINDANRENKSLQYDTTVAHTIHIKPNIRYDHVIEAKHEDKDTTEKSAKPKGSEQKDKHTKNIKEAIKIINSNQNSESINLLANSLQSLSSTLLSEMIYPNFALGSQFNTTLPAEMNTSGNNAVSSTITASSIENKTYVDKNEFIADSTMIVVSPAISTENITDAKEEEGFEDLINILGEEAFETKSTNTAAENINNKITEKFTNTDIPTEGNNKAGSTDIYFTPVIPDGRYIPINPSDTANLNISIGELINIDKQDSLILDNGNDERIMSDSYGLGDNVAVEEFNETVTEEEVSFGEPREQGSVASGESNIQKDIDVAPTQQRKPVGGRKRNVQPVGTSTTDARLILGDNIKQLTLTRGQVIKERKKLAASPTFLRAPHKCLSCIIGFQFYENLEDHFKRKHTRNRRTVLLCDICQQYVDYGFRYDLHLFWHHTRYKCLFCEQLFASYDKAALHYRKQHSNKQTGYRNKEGGTLRCPQCPFKTGTIRLFKEHVSECRPCEQCGLSIGAMTGVTLETHLTNCIMVPSEPKRAKPTPTATETSTKE